MFFDRQQLTAEQIRQKEIEFQRMASNLKEADLVWKEMNGYFAIAPKQEKESLKGTYWRWYVELTWRRLNSINKDNFLRIFHKQLITAIQNNFDIFHSFMEYLGFRCIDKQELASFYQKVKLSVLNSEESIGQWQGSEVLLKDLISEYYLLKKRKASSIEEAEFLTKTKQIIFPADSEPYILADKDVGVTRFLEIVELFQEIDTDRIEYIVDMFLNPENYNTPPNSTNLQTQEEDNVKEENLQEMVVEPLIENAQREGGNSTVSTDAENSSAAESLVNSASKILTADQIKSQIEFEFKKDAEGNFEDIEGVMKRLEELAEQYNKPEIAEMMYFDEGEGKFKWKI